MRMRRLIEGGAVVALLAASAGMGAAAPSLGVVVGGGSSGAAFDGGDADVSPQAALERDVEWGEKPMSLN